MSPVTGQKMEVSHGNFYQKQEAEKCQTERENNRGHVFKTKEVFTDSSS